MKLYIWLFLLFLLEISCKDEAVKKSFVMQVKPITNIDDTENIDWDTLQKLSSTPETALLDSMAEDFIKQWKIQGIFSSA